MQIVTNLVNYIAVLISQIIIIKVFQSFIKIQKKCFSKYLIVLMIISSVIETILAYIIDPSLNSFICIVYFLIIFKLIFKTSIKKNIFYIAALWLIMILIDISLMTILDILQTYIFHVELNIIIVKPMCTIVLIILLVYIIRNKQINNFINKAYKLFDTNYLYLICLLFLYFVLGTIGINSVGKKNVILNLLSLAILFSLTIIKFILYQFEIIELKKTNKNLINNNEFYIKLLDDYQILKHNLTNQLLGIKIVSNKKAKSLINDLIKDYNENFQVIQNIKDVPTSLNGLIYEKLYTFNEKNLVVSVDNNIKHQILSILSSRNYNLLCESLGIVLDNAITAAAKSEDKIIYLNFQEQRDDIVLTIMNSFNGSLDLEELGNINYTSKKNKKNHGYGLYTLLNKRRLSMKTSIRNNLFINEIKIKKKTE